MLERNSLLKVARRSKSASDWAAYKRKRNQVNNLLRREKNSFNRKLLYDNRNNPRKFWKTIKQVYPNKPTTVNSSRAFNLNDDGMTTCKSKISNAFGLFFSSIAQKLKESLNTLRNSIWQKTDQEISPCNRIPDQVFRFEEICPSQVLKALNKLKSTKATGLDDVPPSLIKDASQYIAAPLAYIINLSLSSGIYPAQWKNAKIVPVYKSGSVSELDNYRPISILPAISKIAERLVHDQLAKFLEDSSLLSPTQFGFRSKYSTSLAVTYFTDTIRKEMDRGKLTGAVFIDFRKAFDTVDHAVLIKKMEMLGVRGVQLKWFTDYLSNRQQVVIYDNYRSDNYPVSYGVPQGSILGPLLFLIYIDDLSKVLKHSDVIMYADDTVLYFSHEDIKNIEAALSEDMDAVAQWLQRNQLVINLKKDKSESMVFGTARRLAKEGNSSLCIQIGSDVIRSTTSYVYLGVKLDPTLNFGQYLHRTFKKTSSKLKMLKKIRSSLTVQSARMIYQSMIVPLMTYCDMVTLNLPESWLSKFVNLENRAKKIIANGLSIENGDLNIRDFYSTRIFNAVIVVFKSLNGLSCEPFNDYFQIMSHQQNTRNNDYCLRLPEVKLEVARKGFYFQGAMAFNKLPLHVRQINSIVHFKSALKQMNSF